MDPIATFSGLASGIDFRTLVDQIITAESAPIRQLETQISGAETRADAWESFRSLIGTYQSKAEALADPESFRQYLTSVTALTTSSGMPLSASATSEAQPGTYSVKVLQLASNEKVGGDTYSSQTTALGVSGEFLVNGKAVAVEATDSLQDVADAVNRVNAGSDASGVSASIVSASTGSYRLVLTATEAGAEGIDLADGGGGALRDLGFLGSSTSVKYQTSNGAKSRGYTSATSDIATLAGLTDPPASTAVGVGTFTATVDLSTMSLNDIAEEINTQAGLAGSSVTASVVQETDDDGDTVMRLDIDGTTSFTDANGILETLGVVEADRDAVAQQLQSGSAFTDGDGSTTATSTTLLTDLWLDGASAGTEVGDTLSISGTRADGTTFSKTYTVGSGDDLQDLLDALNSASDGFGAGSATATAALAADGSITVTDDAGGDSRLALSIVSNNEGGGTLDFGDFSVTETGRERELTAGVDAQLEVDGSFVTRSSNSISDVIDGLTLDLLEVSDETATVSVSRNIQAMTEKVQAFVDAFNAMSEFVSQQFSGAGAEEGTADPPLSGDGVLRQMRNNLRDAMLEEIPSSVGGTYTRLGEIGIEIGREGTFTMDTAAFQTALKTDPQSVERLFGVYGAGSVSSLSYLGAADDVEAGTYDVDITQAASNATVTGSGFGGTYVDDATADTLTIQDLDAGSDYSIELSNGMTMTEIVSALNSEFATATKHEIQGSETMYSDAVGTAATASTTLDSLYDSGGTSYGVADGDVITISGTRANGESFYLDYAVTDVTTQTLGDLRSQVENLVGSDEVVTVQNGALDVTARETGRSLLTLSMSSDNAGGGSLTFGAFDTVTEGRGTADITASESGGELKLDHGDWGSAAGFNVSFTAGGTDGSASLGVTAGTYPGTDVAGTVGGLAATGVGQILTGSEGTAVEGLMIRYDGTDTGSVGSITFSRGMASAVEVATSRLLGTETGSIDSVVEGIDPLIDRLNQRIDTIEGRLERRRENLIRQFSRLEEALARAQSQSQWLSSQLQSLGTTNNAG